MLKTNIFFGWWRLEGVCVEGGGAEGGGVYAYWSLHVYEARYVTDIQK